MSPSGWRTKCPARKACAKSSWRRCFPTIRSSPKKRRTIRLARPIWPSRSARSATSPSSLAHARGRSGPTKTPRRSCSGLRKQSPRPAAPAQPGALLQQPRPVAANARRRKSRQAATRAGLGHSRAAGQGSAALRRISRRPGDDAQQSRLIAQPDRRQTAGGPALPRRDSNPGIDSQGRSAGRNEPQQSGRQLQQCQLALPGRAAQRRAAGWKRPCCSS